MANGFTAATVSFTGLVRTFGLTLSGQNEVESGIMTVPSLSDLIYRTLKAGYATGPNGQHGWSADWWSLWNYLQYGVGGCLVGGTGSGFNSGAITVTNTPLHQTDLKFDVIFDCGNEDNTTATSANSSHRAAVSVATTRKDCFAILGATKQITKAVLETAGQTWSTYFGLPDTDWSPQGTTAANIIFVANRKNYIQNWNGSLVGGTNIAKINLSQDVAGCFGRAYSAGTPWSAPGGVVKGRILNVLSLENNYSTAEISNMTNSRRISPVAVLPGRGSFLFGNSTAASPDKAIGDISFQAVLNYLKAELTTIGLSLLLEPNNAQNRSIFTTRATSVIQGIKESGSITSYEIVCNETNNTNTDSTLTARITILPVNAIEAISLTVVNGVVNEEYTL